MTSADPMPWGIHKGKPIGEVPFDYLLTYYKKQWIGGEVLVYLENCLREIEESEHEIAVRLGKKPKKYLIEDYQCLYEK